MPQSAEETQVSSRVFWALLAAIVVLGVATRFHHLGYESLWMDEAITFARSRLSLSKLSENAIRRYHNPTYFILIHYVMKLGDSEFVLRLPSAVAGILKILAVCGLGCVVSGRRVGLLSALLALLLPSQLKYDQEARMYGLLGLATTLATCGLIWLLHNSEAASVRLARTRGDGTLEGKRARNAWVLYIAASIVALYLHNTAVLFVFVCAVASLGGYFESRNRPGFFRNWLFAHVTIAVAFLPWVPTLFHQSDKMLESGWWAVEPDTRAVLSTLAELYGFGASVVWMLVPLGCFAVYGVVTLWNRRAVTLAMLLLAVGGPTSFALVTLYQPMFVLRLMLWSAIPFAVLVATGVLALRPRVLSFLVIGGLVCFAMARLHRGYYAVRQKPDWRGAVELLTREVKPTDVVLATGGGEARSLYYYLHSRHHRLGPLNVNFNVKEMAENLASAVHNPATVVWTIHSRPKAETFRIHEQLALRSRGSRSFQFGPELTVERYQLRLPANPGEAQVGQPAIRN